MAAMMHAVISTTLASASSGGGSPAWLLILGPAGAAGLYFGFWRYYRNTDKSHSFESETRISAQPVTGHDAKVDEITGTKKTSIDGDNKSNHRQRVKRAR
jgi:hypothetical protein